MLQVYNIHETEVLFLNTVKQLHECRPRNFVFQSFLAQDQNTSTLFGILTKGTESAEISKWMAGAQNDQNVMRLKYEVVSVRPVTDTSLATFQFRALPMNNSGAA